jgi:hypothetical protein
MSGWWFGPFLFFHILGISSSQLTETTNRHQPSPTVTNQYFHIRYTMVYQQPVINVDLPSYKMVIFRIFW